MRKVFLFASLLTFVLFSSVISAQQQPDSMVNLALLADATVTGNITGGRGLPIDILYDPSAGNYANVTQFNEYGVALDQNLGIVTVGNGLNWQVNWSTPKEINYITFGGVYPNQPQPNTAWRISYLNNSVWSIIEEGIGGWIDAGIYVWDNTDQQPITADAIKIELFSDGTNDLVSIHLRGRGGDSSFGDDSATLPKATLIQLLPYENCACWGINNDDDIFYETNKVGIGTSTLNTLTNFSTNKFEIWSENGSESDMILRTAGSGYPGSYILNSKGTLAAPTALTTTDNIGWFGFGGHDGTNFINGGGMRAAVDGPVDVGKLPSRLEFLTTNSGTANPTVKMTIKNSGKVGIGTDDPNEDLEVKGTIKSEKLIVDLPSNGIVAQFGNSIPANPGRRNFDFVSWQSSSDPFLEFTMFDNDYNSRFRVMTRSDQEYVVLKNTQNSEVFKVGTANTLPYAFMHMPKADSRFVIGTFGNYLADDGHKFVVKDGSAMIEGNILTNNKIGVGVSSANIPTEYSVAVAGKIISQEVKVQLIADWPDYVFSKDYKLLTLKDVENYISKNGHLPNIPSAEEVEKQGVLLGEMDSKLLQKIEELTLYTIEQQKEIDNQRRINENLEKRLKKLEKILGNKE